ncbi:MAG: hypothetical protein IT438_12355 [Phycisphaerales bacterium]|nr:hypothetical protein [Phycisphaerales bacterium]
MSRPRRDPRILLGYVTAITYAAIMGGKAAVWGFEDKARLPIILAPLLLIACAIIGIRWWNRTRHEEWLRAGGRAGTRIGTATPRCRKCGTSLEDVDPRPVSIDGLNVVRVVCPSCGRISG